MKKYGIYLAYPPSVDLRSEGLGRYLTEFLKGAQARSDLQFVIACPSWMQKHVIELFDDAGVGHDYFEIITPQRKRVLLLKFYEAYLAFKKCPKQKGRLVLFFRRLSEVRSHITTYAKIKLARRSLISVLVIGPLILIFILLVIIFKVLIKVLRSFVAVFFTLTLKALRSFISFTDTKSYLDRIRGLVKQIKQNPFSELNRLKEESEPSMMLSLIERRSDISAWYCPNAFWPDFNKIQAPRLMCVPDVVLADFPVSFACEGGEHLFDHFRQVKESIEGGQYFVTYSENVKWRTLVERYNIDSEVIKVVNHGANRLEDFLFVAGSPDNEEATNSLCRNLFRTALRKAVNNEYAGNFDSEEGVQFIFYASQFRPNKNIISLLKAYEYLLKRRYIGWKLILSGDPNHSPAIARFIIEHNLVNDVLCLHGLSSQELAACYRLADLAVNTSLSEGGFPFTFTEALSVGTPVIMSRIAVTEEIITDPNLQEQMLFNPYDWKEMADKIEWGLNNHDALLETQKRLYKQISKRTWSHVVDEHIKILDRISLVKQG
jgi:glycosyltransferase involved in cell wall biosynthesis